MNYEKALNFLLFSYFGFDSNADENIMKEKAAYRAYVDLARTVKYTYSSDYISKHIRNSDIVRFQEVRNERIKSICRNLIDSINNFSGDFDEWHNTRCDEIKDKMNDNSSPILKKEFTYGQAQKWVNMTLKYLWLLGLLPSGIREKNLHVPIDSFILEKLNDKDMGVADISCSGETYYYNKETWSAMESNNYISLQNEIKKAVEKNAPTQSPIQWESTAWMEIAAKRSSK